jgi:hypothetical protein
MTTPRREGGDGSRAGALDRRGFLAGAGAGAVALVVSGAALIHPDEAWGLEVKSLKPATMATLIAMARDIYPHDRLVDRFYAIAVKSFDDKAAADPKTRAMIESGVADLDARAKKAFGTPYRGVGWEAQRVTLLRQIESGALFKAVRPALVVSLYNQQELWPIFGYEGESAGRGGYISRGFNDLTWL